jgi:opacity protein-like surface antigen
MRVTRPLLVVLVVLSVGGLVVGQSSDRVEVFGGYTYLNADYSLATTNGSGGANGWNASANFKVRPSLGLVADFSGFYPSSGVKEYTFLFGPQFSLQRGRFSPFARFLIGASHVSGDTIGTNNANLLTSNNSFSLAAGGGVDYSITRRIAIRAGLDWLRNKFTPVDNQIPPPARNAVRISTGVVFRY